MSKKPYPYPPDEFETVDANSRPKEVHAARRSTWSRIWPFIVVIVVVPAIAFGVVKYLSLWSSSSSDDGTAPAAAPTVTQTLVDPPEPTETGADPVVDPTDTLPPEDSTDAPTQSDEPEAPVDRDLSVKILNAKGVNGLAGKAAELLTADSWHAVSTGDYNGGKREGESAVYYTKKAQRASAQLVADILQIDTVTKDKSQAANGAIAVVLRADFNLPDPG